jgi:transposase-like protein
VVRGVSDWHRQLEEMMDERSVAVDHSTLNRWVIKYASEVEKQCRRRQRAVERSWRSDETYVNMNGKWASLYRAVDRAGLTVDFFLSEYRERGVPEKITHDGYTASHEAVAKLQDEDVLPAVLTDKQILQQPD